MSYTLRGRLESRLGAGVVPLVVGALLGAVLREWWPVELAVLMLAVGVAVDVALLHRLLPYQAGWVALPIGVAELALVMATARVLGIEAPLGAAVGLFVASWLFGQVLGHAVFPLVHLTYAEDGGELGRLGVATAAAALAVVAAAGGVASATAPPTVRLEAGLHRGPLVLDSEQILVGEPGAVVRGGIRVTADGVRVKNVTVVGGEHGIVVDDAEGVVLEDVTVRGTRLDAIHVRHSSVAIRDCRIGPLTARYAQGIDISFAFDLAPSLVEDCVVTGGLEGIVSHFSHVAVRDNVVAASRLRAITLTEMSDGIVEDNDVRGALGVGIFCGDYSMCEVTNNTISGTRADHASDDRTRMGYAIVSHYWSHATVGDNRLVENAAGVAAFIKARISHRRDE